MPIVEEFHLPVELTVEFLGTFARFEYALKRAGYIAGSATQPAADWDRIGRELANLAADEVAPVLAAGQYLQSDPPRKQVNDGGRLIWKDRGPSGGTAIEELLLSVRAVRNNVFHGGKFPECPIAEPLRDERLVLECVAVLMALLSVPVIGRDLALYFHPED